MLVAQVSEADVKLCPTVFLCQYVISDRLFRYKDSGLTSLASEFTWRRYLEQRNQGGVSHLGILWET